MKNVTISIKESVEKAVRVLAAQTNKSLSRFISDLLEEKITGKTKNKIALQEFLETKPYLSTKNYKFDREELYDRKVLR